MTIKMTRQKNISMREDVDFQIDIRWSQSILEPAPAHCSSTASGISYEVGLKNWTQKGRHLYTQCLCFSLKNVLSVCCF